jgi:hypothetical protein
MDSSTNIPELGVPIPASDRGGIAVDTGTLPALSAMVNSGTLRPSQNVTRGRTAPLVAPLRPPHQRAHPTSLTSVPVPLLVEPPPPQFMSARPLSPRDATEVRVDGLLFDPSTLPPIQPAPSLDPTPIHTMISPRPIVQQEVRSERPTTSMVQPQARTSPTIRSDRPTTPVVQPQVRTSPIAAPEIRPYTPTPIPSERVTPRVSPVTRPYTPILSARATPNVSPVPAVSPILSRRATPEIVSTPEIRPYTPVPNVTSGRVTTPISSSRAVTTPTVTTPISSSRAVTTPTVQPQQARAVTTPTMVHSGRGSDRSSIRSPRDAVVELDGYPGQRSVGRERSARSARDEATIINPVSPISIPFSPVRTSPPVIPVPFSPTPTSPPPRSVREGGSGRLGQPEGSGRRPQVIVPIPVHPRSSGRSVDRPERNDRTDRPERGDRNERAGTAPAAPAVAVPLSLAERYGAMTGEEQARIRADFRVKYGILRTAYPRFGIPELGEETPLDEIHAQYERYVRQIYIDGNVDQYKWYLIILWLIIECVCTRWLGLDLMGYTMSQMSVMNRYDRLLIELGEKDSGPTASSWPVEARIIVLSLFNAVLFLIVKVVGSYLGNSMASIAQNFINGLLSGNNTQTLINDLNRAQAGNTAAADNTNHAAASNGGGGFDISAIIGLVTNIIGGAGNTTGGNTAAVNNPAPARPRAARRPRHTE